VLDAVARRPADSVHLFCALATPSLQIHFGL
jgi:hypothetical protein